LAIAATARRETKRAANVFQPNEDTQPASHPIPPNTATLPKKGISPIVFDIQRQR
jgi:hypothetical protein